MSTLTNDGGPAFRFGQVSEVTGQPINGFFAPGMSLRDWFAGQWLGSLGAYYSSPECSPGTPAEMAKWSYEIADAMLAAREVRP